jgi:hypothetical protein
MTMEAVVPGLWASPPDGLPFDSSLSVRSFLLQRNDGNLLLYRGDAVVAVEQHQVDELGGISRQYLNHRHEASPSSDRISNVYGAPLLVHRDEAEAVAKTAVLGALFFQRHELDGDFEVIPTPGHTAGATAYLWDSDAHRVLFTGDTIYFRDDQWSAAVLGSSDRESYLRSLELIRALDFDVLVPWVATEGGPYYAIVDEAERRRRIDAILMRLERGGEH